MSIFYTEGRLCFSQSKLLLFFRKAIFISFKHFSFTTFLWPFLTSLPILNFSQSLPLCLFLGTRVGGGVGMLCKATQHMHQFVELVAPSKTVKKSQDSLITWSCKVTRQICYNSTTRRPMAIKLSKVGSYNKELPCIKSHNPLNTWSHEVIWNTLYLYYYKASGFYTWQSSNFP